MPLSQGCSMALDTSQGQGECQGLGRAGEEGWDQEMERIVIRSCRGRGLGSGAAQGWDQDLHRVGIRSCRGRRLGSGAAGAPWLLPPKKQTLKNENKLSNVFKSLQMRRINQKCMKFSISSDKS